MPIANVIVVAAIIFIFVLFALVLWWGARQTRDLHRE